jgi:hypothetical protein
LAALVAACQPSRRAPAAPAEPVPTRLAVGVTDSAAYRRGVGSLLVYARAADPSAAPLEGAQVLVRRAPGAAPVRSASTDGRGGARLDSLAAGPYSVSVRRIGSVPEEWPVDVGAGCDNAIEVRLAPNALCLFHCPPARVPPVITTCRTDA